MSVQNVMVIQPFVFFFVVWKWYRQSAVPSTQRARSAAVDVESQRPQGFQL